MDQNSPEDVFALSSYLNREQYGERPSNKADIHTLPDIVRDANGNPENKEGKAIWKRVKKNENEPDKYVVTDYKRTTYINLS